MAAPPDLRSVAERSEYTLTASYEETVALIDALAAWKPSILRRASMGATEEGRDIPLLIAADPPVETPSDACAATSTGRLIIFAFGNIHAGEVEGKEALPMLARWLAEAPDAPAQRAILDRCVVIFAPIFNADGNERTGPADINRPGQNGPAVVGIRANANGLDLNRDYTKAEAAETRAMLFALVHWDPHVVIDCHTTNGSEHRYTLTFEAPLTTAGPRGPVQFVRETLLPDVMRRTAEAGYDTWWYGDFAENNTEWRSYSAQARFGGNYHALRGLMSVLAEAYSYAPYRERVLCTFEFVRACISSAAERATEMRDIVAAAQTDAAHRAPGHSVALAHSIAPFAHAATVKGFAADEHGARTPKDYDVRHFGRFEASRTVAAPAAYLLPPGPAGDAAVALLNLHFVDVLPVEEQREREVEEALITRVTLSEKEFQGRRLAQCETLTRPARRAIGPGWREVRTDQPFADLVVILLEPESEDGMAAWGLLPKGPTGAAPLIEGQPFPILRIRNTDW